MEKFPQPEREKEGRSADQVLMDVNRMWGIISDVEGLPLSVDPAYQYGKELIDVNAEEYARTLLEAAQKASGTDRLRYITGLERLFLEIGKEQKEHIAEKLKLTPEAVAELHKKTEEEISYPKKPVGERLDIIDEFLSYFKRRKKNE
jgi:hypothetical protein